MFWGQVAGVDAIMGHERLAIAAQKILQLPRQGRKAAVETHRQQWGVGLFVQSGEDLFQFGAVERQGFFTINVLAACRAASTWRA